MEARAIVDTILREGFGKLRMETKNEFLMLFQCTK